MVSTLERRVSDLETAYGGSDSCERCRNTIIIVGLGGEISVHKNGTRLTSEAARAFHREEEPDGTCPRCGNIRHKVVIRWGAGSSYAR